MTRMGAGPDWGKIWSMDVFRAVVNSFTMEECTTMRSVAMQICPLCRNAPIVQPCAAFSIFASLSTSAGALPPSSISRGLRCLPACAAIMLPVAVLPV